MFIFLSYPLNLSWGNVSNSNVTMKFAQLYYFYHKMLGGTKDIMSTPVQNLGDLSPPSPHKLGPCCKETWDFGLTQRFLRLVHKQ